MIYMSYQTSADLLDPFRALARTMADALPHLAPGHIEEGGPQATWLRSFWAGCQLIARSGMSHKRPSFDIHTVPVGNREVAVTEEALLHTPFATLLQFRKPPNELNPGAKQPKVLLVAP